MAVRLLDHHISDICLGKPALRSISLSATLADALSALKKLGENYISVWSCASHSSKSATHHDCRYIAKISVLDVILFLCKQDNLSQPAVALQSSVSVLIPAVPVLVRHLEPHARCVISFPFLIFYSDSHLPFYWKLYDVLGFFRVGIEYCCVLSAPSWWKRAMFI